MFPEAISFTTGSSRAGILKNIEIPFLFNYKERLRDNKLRKDVPVSVMYKTNLSLYYTKCIVFSHVNGVI